MVEAESTGQAWGRLVPLFGDDRVPVEMFADLFSIGRKKDCDLRLSSFSVVSGCHCCIIRDPDGKVWLQDTSTNGTVINAEKKVLDDVCEIEHRTEFYLVFRRNVPAECVGFRFENVADLRESPEPLSRTDPEIETDTAEKTQEMDNEYFGSDHSSEAEDGEGDGARAASPDAEKTPVKRSMTSQNSSGSPKRSRCDSSPQPGPSHEEPQDQGLLDTLTCAICQDILYDCVSVQPCLHSFCAGCFSGWMEGTCPQCRKRSTRVSRNHLVNNVVEEYLKKHPDQRRTQEDRDELDKKNRIKDAVLTLGGSSPDSDSSSSSSSNHRSTLAVHLGNIRRVYQRVDFIPPVCPQCPNAAHNIFSHYQPRPALQPPPFQCHPVGTVHVLCQCCLGTMPQRTEPEISARQKCTVCSSFFCRQYFGCSVSCRECLMPLRDTNLTGPLQIDMVLRNGFETRILMEYMREKNITLRQLMVACADNFTSHQYYTPTYTGTLTGDSLVCRNCGQRLLREFAYHYRAAVPREELPMLAQNRPDCQWGRNCRTQVRPHHAERYNHICEQRHFDSGIAFYR